MYADNICCEPCCMHEQTRPLQSLWGCFHEEAAWAKRIQGEGRGLPSVSWMKRCWEEGGLPDMQVTPLPSSLSVLLIKQRSPLLTLYCCWAQVPLTRPDHIQPRWVVLISSPVTGHELLSLNIGCLRSVSIMWRVNKATTILSNRINRPPKYKSNDLYCSRPAGGQQLDHLSAACM